MRRLSSGWDLGLRLYSNNRNLLSSAVSQSHVNTVHTSYSQHRHREKKKKKKKENKPHISNTVLPQKSMNDPTPPPSLPLPSPITQTKLIHYTFRMTIYTIHKWYRTAPFQKCKKKIKEERDREREREKSLCFSLLLHSRMSINKQKNEYIRSLRRLTSSFKILKYGSGLALAERWSLD